MHPCRFAQETLPQEHKNLGNFSWNQAELETMTYKYHNEHKSDQPRIDNYGTNIGEHHLWAEAQTSYDEPEASASLSEVIIKEHESKSSE